MNAFILVQVSIQRMYDPSSPRYSNFRDQSREMQVLRSIDTKTQSSSQAEVEQLMVRLLMLSIEIDRKDMIIRELLNATNNNQYQIQIEEFSIRCQKYQMEIKTLNQTIHMLKENISIIESTKNREVFNSVNNQFNEELENKVYSLEAKLRKVEDQKIGLEEQLKQNKLNQSMAEYKFIRNEQTQKGRVRQLENLLITERGRAETERKTSMEKAIIIEDLKSRLLHYETNEKMIVQQYQEKLRMFQNQFIHHENLKKSQIVSTEERINASSQEIYRLSEEIKYLKQNLDSQRENARSKDKEISRLIAENKANDNKYIRLEGEFKQASVRFESRGQQLKFREKELAEKESLIKKMNADSQEVKFFFNNKNQEIQIYSAQITRLKEEITDIYHQNDLQRNEIRKLKRKPISQGVLCESCKIKESGSSSLITSQKSIKGLNIEDIIQQTEQLFRSNRKIQSLINRHESGQQSSIHLYNQQAYQN